jgi:short-subunit dehydrogenase
MVETPMTEGISAPDMLLAKPEQIASDIVNAIEKKKDVLYTPWFWKYIMMAIIHIPNTIFKKSSL